jgi:hypothetical protein
MTGATPILVVVNERSQTRPATVLESVAGSFSAYEI